MRKHRLLLVAGAVAAALAATQAVAQYGTGFRGDRSAAAAYSDPYAWDPYYFDGRRAWYPHPRAHIGPDNAYRSPTDGDSGGAGIPAANGAVPNTLPLVSSGEPPYPPSSSAGDYYRFRERLAGGSFRTGSSTDPMVNPQRSATDGRSGGTGVPSSSSGAVPSTQPQEDASTRGGYRTQPYVVDRPVSSSAPGMPSNPERSVTDGRSGGTNLPSPQSGATPSTSPTTIR